MEREREREREREIEGLNRSEFVCIVLHVCVYTCAWKSVCFLVCVCVKERERERESMVVGEV